MENVQAKQAIETLTSRNGLRFTEWTQLRFILKQLDTNVFIQLQLPPLFVGLARYGHRQSVLLQRGNGLAWLNGTGEIGATIKRGKFLLAFSWEEISENITQWICPVGLKACWYFIFIYLFFKERLVCRTPVVSWAQLWGPKPHQAEVPRCFGKPPDYVSSTLPPAGTRTSSLPVSGSALTAVPTLSNAT